MMERLANPTPKLIGGFAVVTLVVLIGAAYLIRSDDPELSAYAFPPILIGLVLLFMTLSLLALRALNRVQDKTPPVA